MDYPNDADGEKWQRLFSSAFLFCPSSLYWLAAHPSPVISRHIAPANPCINHLKSTFCYNWKRETTFFHIVGEWCCIRFIAGQSWALGHFSSMVRCGFLWDFFIFLFCPGFVSPGKQIAALVWFQSIFCLFATLRWVRKYGN